MPIGTKVCGLFVSSGIVETRPDGAGYQGVRSDDGRLYWLYPFAQFKIKE